MKKKMNVKKEEEKEDDEKKKGENVFYKWKIGFINENRTLFAILRIIIRGALIFNRCKKEKKVEKK